MNNEVKPLFSIDPKLYVHCEIEIPNSAYISKKYGTYENMFVEWVSKIEPIKHNTKTIEMAYDTWNVAKIFYGGKLPIIFAYSDLLDEKVVIAKSNVLMLLYKMFISEINKTKIEL